MCTALFLSKIKLSSAFENYFVNFGFDYYYESDFILVNLVIMLTLLIRDFSLDGDFPGELVTEEEAPSSFKDYSI